VTFFGETSTSKIDIEHKRVWGLKLLLLGP
jgi:hypothetical protein